MKILLWSIMEEMKVLDLLSKSGDKNRRNNTDMLQQRKQRKQVNISYVILAVKFAYKSHRRPLSSNKMTHLNHTFLDSSCVHRGRICFTELKSAK